MQESEMNIDEVKYSLSKHLNDDSISMKISTEYGNIPMSDGDIVEVRQLLRQRFEDRLCWMEA